VARDTDQWRALVQTVKNHRLTSAGSNSSSSRATISLSKKNLVPDFERLQEQGSEGGEPGRG
jgi:hypothetical protein